MGHVSWEELEQELVAASQQVSFGSLWPDDNTPGAHEVTGYCIIEATDQAGVLHRAIDIASPTFVTPLALPPNAASLADLDIGELALQCRLASLKVSSNSRWEHTKTHGIYHVIGLCVMNALAEPEIGVLYHDIAHPHITFARSLADWLGLVDIAGKPVLKFRELA